MKKLTLALAIIALAVLISTNPNKATYIDYTEQRILGHSPSGLVSMFTGPLIDRTTAETNLLFATVYRTRFGENEAMTLGIAGKFIPLK